MICIKKDFFLILFKVKTRILLLQLVRIIVKTLTCQRKINIYNQFHCFVIIYKKLSIESQNTCSKIITIIYSR